MRTIFFNPSDGRVRAGWRVVLQLLLFFVIVFGAAIAAGVQLAPWVKAVHFVVSEEQQAAAGALITTVCMAISVLVARRIFDRRSWRTLGLRLDRRWFADLVAGYVVGFALFAFVFVVLWAAGWVRIAAIAFDARTIGALALAFVTHVGVGVGEELTARGYDLTNFEEGMTSPGRSQRVATLWAVLFSSIIFGLMHASNDYASPVAILNLVLTGVALAAPFVLTRQLGFSIGVHAAWNFAQGAIFGFNVSGHATHASLLHVQSVGPESWTGGRFGPEAGWLDPIASLLLIAIAFAYVRGTRGGAAIATPEAEPRDVAMTGEGAGPTSPMLAAIVD